MDVLSNTFNSMLGILDWAAIFTDHANKGRSCFRGVSMSLNTITVEYLDVASSLLACILLFIIATSKSNVKVV